MISFLSYALIFGAAASAAAILDRRRLSSHSTTRDKPNILYFLLDDFGWGDAGWHWSDGKNPNALATPSMTKYATEEGLELDRHYAYQFCSPTRSAIQTGRNPLMVNGLNLKMDVWTSADNVSGLAGVPTEMTFIAEKLQNVGYETHIYGKWDIGATSKRQLPHAHGYDHSLVYFGHGNDPWTFFGGECSGNVELWGDSQPITFINDLAKDPAQCSQEMQDGCVYQESIFASKVEDAIRTHTKPFFIFWSTHLVHGPYGVPNEYTKVWKDNACIESDTMLLFYGMVDYLDKMFGKMMDLLKDQGEWDNTLVIVHSDNGAAITEKHAGNNYPLRGGKASNWEGGVRVPAFVTGGWLPEDRRGKKSESLITAWDWYHTLTALTGENISDWKAQQAGLPNISDSVNQLPMLQGKGSQRDTIYFGQPTPGEDDSAVQVSAFIKNHFKILVGSVGHNMTTNQTGASQAFRESADYVDFRVECGTTPATGCLFNIFADSSESRNLASTKPDLFWEMLRGMRSFGEPFNPDRGTLHDDYCDMTKTAYGGFNGPVLN